VHHSIHHTDQSISEIKFYSVVISTTVSYFEVMNLRLGSETSYFVYGFSRFSYHSPHRYLNSILKQAMTTSTYHQIIIHNHPAI